MNNVLTKYWLICHNPDCNETGMTQDRTYLKTTWVGFPAQQSYELAIIQDWCRERFGSEVAYVQGIAATLAWHVSPSSLAAWEAADPQKWGGYNTPTRKVEMTIGNGGELTIVSDVLQE
jgi:hypothetical protein